MHLTPLDFAGLAALLVALAYQLASDENERGHYWRGLISGLLAIGTLGAAEFSLFSTPFAAVAFCIGLPVLMRIALELGFSFSEIVLPELSG